MTNSVSTLGPAKMWIGLKNSDDNGLWLDLLVEVLLNGTKIGGGQVNNVSAGGTGFNYAILQTIALTGSGSAPSGAQLQIKVSARRTCFGGGHAGGTVRLWYNGAFVDSGPSRDAGSRFGATTAAGSSNYFLRSGAALSTTAGASRTFVDVAVDSRTACATTAKPTPDRPFQLFGTWSITLP